MKPFLALRIAFLAVLAGLFLPGVRAATPQRPNVVLILIDDLSHYGVTAYGADRLSCRSPRGPFENVRFQTPRMDQLAREGLLCDRAYVYPLCENTRVALMSGQNNNRNYLNCKIQHHSDITFGDTFKRAGYATGIFGKWKQTRGTPTIPAERYLYEFGWDEFACFDVVTEGQRYINPNLVINGEIHNYEGRTDIDPATGRRWYGPDICNRAALEFIDRHKDEPFFLYYPMILVHDEHQPTPDTEPREAFDNFQDAPHLGYGKRPDDPRYFPDMIEYADKLIGRIVDKIDQLGLTENTLIVVMGDNGTKEIFTHILPDGSTYPGRKGGTADNGLHVPLILRQPGTIPAGKDGALRRYDGLIHVTDIYPTIAEAAGVEIPNRDAIDGISFWPQATGAPGEPRRYIHGWHNGNNPYTSRDTLIEFVFDKHFKRYAPDPHYPRGRLFDLRTDLFERAGGEYVELKWGVRKYRGLDLDHLTDEQRAAWERLGRLLEKHRHVPVKALRIENAPTTLRVGETATIHCAVLPANATRRNIIWESDNPAVLDINKFGDLTARARGTATIHVYSWDDAWPQASGRAPEYRRDGITDAVTVTVE